MKAYHNLVVGGEEYKLRLTTSAIKSIEKRLGKPLFTAMDNIQENLFDTVAAIIWGAAQPFNANFSYEKAEGLFDQYVEDGHDIEDWMNEILELFAASGFLKKGQEL
ncbi:MAG: DUF6096 family protein [Defluviitaleaceae bacterium]|nr:DUF6096 family protein [Defluviitaleaceae bacterium]